MNQIDLNIDNYELSDILNLFNISYNFNKEDLKNCKKYVLKTHPDKSNLPKEYFFFFSKAYKLLYEIYNFKSKQDSCPTQYKDILNIDTDSNNKKLEYINKITNDTNFNKNFNIAFTKNNITNEFTKTGYNNWLKTSEILNIKDSGNANNSIENYKKNLLIKTENILDIEHNNYSDIDGGIPTNYAAPIFSKLNYDDLKKAHTESIIPVSYKDMPKHQVDTVEELQHIRSNPITMPSLEQSKQLLNKKKTIDNHTSTVRAYNLAKQGIDAEKSNNQFNTMFNRLNYKK